MYNSIRYSVLNRILHIRVLMDISDRVSSYHEDHSRSPCAPHLEYLAAERILAKSARQGLLSTSRSRTFTSLLLGIQDRTDHHALALS
jgi:hypothetical protein